MATYREIVGKKIKKVSSDPSSGLDGEMWYNSTTGTLRGLAILEAWSSSAALAQNRYGAGGLGSQTAAVIAGGRISPPNAVQSISEEYNGTGFVSGGSLNTGRFNLGACGTEPAGLAFAGNEPSVSNKTETYNGSSWTAGNTMNTARAGVGGCGTQTAALAVGGPSGSTASESFNGSTWTSTPSINTGRTAGRSTGTSTAAIFMGGEGAAPSYTLYANTESFDGSSWSEVSDMGAAKYLMGQSGSSTAAIVFGGRISATNQTATEKWDGTSWTTSPATLGTAFGYGGAAGSPSNTAALQAGSLGPSPATASSAFSQEYNVSTNVITNGAWASGNNINTARTLGGSAIPSVSDGIIFGGGAPYKDATEKYDGTTWTTLPGTLNTARGYMSGFGTSTAAVAAGGYTAPNNPQSLVEEYNGSSWSEETNLPGSRKSAGNCGTLTAGLIMGGSTAQPYAPNVVNTAFEYNGTSWTATPGNMPEAKGQGMSGGTQTAAYYCGGRTSAGPTSYTTKTAEYDGSSFSEGGDIISIGGPPTGGQGATGTQTAGLATGGTPTTTNTYNGTSWVTAANFNTGRNRCFSGGTATAALIAGGGEPGGSPGYGNETEEFTGATESANIKTFTTS